MNVAPSTGYEAVFAAGETGLVGTLALGLLDNQGGITDPLDPTGIIETPAGSGIYAATRTSPPDAGQYTLLWSLDGTTNPAKVSIDDLVVTSSAPGAPPTGDTYGTTDELARILKIRTPTADQTAAMERVLLTATGEIDSEISRVDDLAGWQVALVTEVCLERAVEHWQQEESPFGIIGMGEPNLVYTARDSWDRHAHKLAPLKQGWGLA
jgi:hypothetical protein